jgi:hypothetical protein
MADARREVRAVDVTTKVHRPFYVVELTEQEARALVTQLIYGDGDTEKVHLVRSALAKAMGLWSY